MEAAAAPNIRAAASTMDFNSTSLDFGNTARPLASIDMSKRCNCSDNFSSLISLSGFISPAMDNENRSCCAFIACLYQVDHDSGVHQLACPLGYADGISHLPDSEYILKSGFSTIRCTAENPLLGLTLMVSLEFYILLW